MARIAYILLCHDDADAAIALVRSLTAAGDAVAVHLDARAPRGTWQALCEGLSGNANVVFAPRRTRCGWGEWSLVRATLDALRAARDAFADATHFFLISADCMPIKSAGHIHAQLDAHNVDRIESADFFASNWIRTGWTEERLIYRHWFNERTQKRRFYAMYEIQRRLGLTRAIPDDLRVMIGSQWWCLRRATVDAVLDFLTARPEVERLFRTTWIPDETIFQTLVRHLVPEAEIDNRPPTFLTFTDYGMPVVFHDDHYDMLVGQRELFARKISREALDLRRRLHMLYTAEGVGFTVSDEGRALHAFLTGQGRIGQRFAPRFWERAATPDPDWDLMILVCKKRDVGKRLVGRIREATGLACHDYLFDEEDCPLPDLGGVATTLEKRGRHRRAALQVLYEHHDTDRLLICLDPQSHALIDDFARDRNRTRLLEVQCDHSDAWLAGHARRLGLAGAHTSDAALSDLLPSLRNAIMHERDRIRSARHADHVRIREGDAPAAIAAALEAFLAVERDIADRIADQNGLFADEE
ncbi:DUF5928 domain-containing protein [Citreimonas salinaria]|uniref:Peptide O-xylosyltransferase n=1 Tax=Citreimonas salinaria TaxID=321339 RepID=A0A1H3KD42_9RHOB|nr:DUF5928 domain-containing protein [Citreimonas salinaria]SDY50132.1 Core-2/I-Branching enzyme [Citreimonas salinaria]